MFDNAARPSSSWYELTKAIALAREQIVLMLADLRTKIVYFRALTTLQDTYRQDTKMMTQITDLKEEMILLRQRLQSSKIEDEENQTRHDEERDQIALQDMHGEETEMMTRTSSPPKKRCRVLSTVRYGDGWRVVPPPPPPPMLTY